MKHFFSIFCLLLFSLSNHAQSSANSLPAGTAIVPYQLEVGYNVNTAIVFPGTIKKAYWGYKDIMAMQVPDIENVLLVKAAQKGFDPTNLHVFTLDGKLYVFNISYTDNPARTTFDLTKIKTDVAHGEGSPISFSGEPLDEVELGEAMQKAREAEAFLSKSTSQFDLRLLLKGIYFKENLLFFNFELSNKSTLDYDIDFTHLYIKDKVKSKRSSFQQRELIPVKIDPLTTINGLGSQNFVVAVPRFTIPDKKEFLFEVYELHGGRNISLKIKNRHILKAKRF